MSTEIKSLDDACTKEVQIQSARSEVKKELYVSLDRYCQGKISNWNKKMDKFIENLWHKAYHNNFADEYSRAVFNEVIALKQKRLDPAEYN